MSTRRTFLTAALAPLALAQSKRDWTGQEPIRYPDPDVIVLDKRFSKYKVGNSQIQRVYTGALWAEGPAWHAGGQYLVFSDIPNNRQLRRVEEDGHVSVIRPIANFSNGNTFDYEGRQLSCEHDTRRVVRYENNGSVTVLAENFNGKRFNAPNDIVVHPDGGIWFTDPGYGINGLYEGHPDKYEMKEAVYRIDKSGRIDQVADDLFKPNGLCFSPDYKKLYVCDTGATHYDAAKRIIQVYDVEGQTKLTHSKVYCSMALAGFKEAGLADGIRADTDGNIWAGAGWVGPGYDGVHIFAPDGQRIGQILLPEICANLCFGGKRRNKLYMCASQSVYSVYVETTGAHIC